MTGICSSAGDGGLECVPLNTWTLGIIQTTPKPYMGHDSHTVMFGVIGSLAKRACLTVAGPCYTVNAQTTVLNKAGYRAVGQEAHEYNDRVKEALRYIPSAMFSKVHTQVDSSHLYILTSKNLILSPDVTKSQLESGKSPPVALEGSFKSDEGSGSDTSARVNYSNSGCKQGQKRFDSRGGVFSVHTMAFDLFCYVSVSNFKGKCVCIDCT